VTAVLVVGLVLWFAAAGSEGAFSEDSVRRLEPDGGQSWWV